MTLFPWPIDTERLEGHLQHLCGQIGVRLAGTQGEADAALYCRTVFDAAGAVVSEEPFEVFSREVTHESLEVRINGAWRSFPCSLLSSTPGTEGRPVEAPLEFYAGPVEYARKDLGHLRGKAVVHLGSDIESRDDYRRLMEAEPAFLLFVNVRYPGSVPIADGMFPAYTRSLGARPIASVAYQDAWQWSVEGADAARLSVSGGMTPGQSQNVIAQLPGSREGAGVVYLGAHHDTQADSVGADDNASGVAGLLELARVLAPIPRKRAIRLVSFGAEEQLSVGSAEYVRTHRESLAESGRLMFNLDSYSSYMGWSTLTVNGPEPLAGQVESRFIAGGVYPLVNREIVPSSDHFPFVAAGVPSIWLGRDNCTSGRFFHHRPDDDLSRVSVNIMARQLDVIARYLADLTNTEDLPFQKVVPEAQARKAADFWEGLFGGW